MNVIPTRIGRFLLLWTLVLGAFGTAVAQETGQWRSELAMPTPRAGASVVALDGEIYVVGGRDDRGRPLAVLERFDVVMNRWETLEPMPTARFDAAAVAYRGRLVVLGGRGSRRGSGEQGGVLDVVELYDPARDEWSEMSSLVEGREGHAAFVLNDTLFALGGSNRQQAILGSVEYFAPAATGEGGEWQTASRLNLDVPRAGLAVAVAGGRAYAIGGFTPVPVNFVQEFRHSEFQLTLPAGLFRARGSHAAAALGDSIFVMGGRGPGGGGPLPQRPVLAEVDLYIPSLGRWESFTPMREARESFGSAAVGSVVYVVGGRSEDGSVLASMESMVISTGTASEQPDMVATFFLEQNAPNPFSGRTTIAFGTSAIGGSVRLEVFDVQGRRVSTLVEGSVPAGRNEIAWDGRSDSGATLPSGIYLYRLSQGSHQAFQKLVLVH